MQECACARIHGCMHAHTIANRHVASQAACVAEETPTALGQASRASHRREETARWHDRSVPKLCAANRILVRALSRSCVRLESGHVIQSAHATDIAINAAALTPLATSSLVHECHGTEHRSQP